MLVTSIFSFSHSVFYSITREIVILATFNLLSANAFNLVMAKNLSFGKELNPTEANCIPVIFADSGHHILFLRLSLCKIPQSSRGPVWLTWVCIHQPFFRTFFVYSPRFVNLNATQLLIGLTVWFSQSNVVLYSNASR